MQIFLKELKQFKRRRQGWLIKCLLLKAAGFFLVLAALLCWLDLFLSLSATVRIVSSGISFIGLFIWLGIRIVLIWRISNKESAIYADHLVKSRRRVILSALELGQYEKTVSPVSKYLVHAGIETALDQLRTLTDIRPAEKLKKLYSYLAISLAISLLPALFNLSASQTLVSRLFLPYADIPPYSFYKFTISPASPQVIYGSDLVIKVSIKGKSVKHPVRFVTRQGENMVESACFQASATEYLQKLEGVMQSGEFCFRVGKARSEWHQLKVLFQPHVQSAQIHISPPSYTKREEKTFTLGSEPLKGMKNSSVELKILSNRPLKSGNLLITPVDGTSHSRIITGIKSGKNEITYNWQIKTNAHLAIIIVDIMGTEASEPLKVVQALIPDTPPVVTLSEPTAYALATPGIKVPIVGSVEDDTGISRCNIYRALKGYRSRPVSVDTVPGTEFVEIEKQLDLSRLGVEPGQVIELFLEASDTNPDLTGVGGSDIVRIKIISEDEYAKIIRSKITLEAFEKRFLEVANKYNELLHLLSQAADDLENPESAQDDARGQIKSVQEKIKETADTFKKIAADFSAFDLEKELSATTLDIVADLVESLEHKGWESSDNTERLEAVTSSIKLLNNQFGTIGNLKTDTEEVMAVGRVMAMASLYKALLDRQYILVNKLEQYARGERKIAAPRIMAEQEQAIRKDLNGLILELEKRSQELPGKYKTLKDSSLEFVRAVRELNIPAPMQACEIACNNEQPREAWGQARHAYEKMKQALDSCKGNSFAQLCSGDIGFKVPDHLSRTMAEMLQSLKQQYGYRVSWGDGIGAAGTGLGGTWQGGYLNGYSAFNLPVYGPERKGSLTGAPGNEGGQQGQATGFGIGKKIRYQEKMQLNELENIKGGGFFMKAVPPRYQDAVKKFYGDEL